MPEFAVQVGEELRQVAHFLAAVHQQVVSQAETENHFVGIDGCSPIDGPDRLSEIGRACAGRAS
ncbi:hypothetical protein ACIHDR_47950 [Nocardia sp. NPDC052278]|uniref:hypothetical protein n=1 Tax=unclassified Nocardia TaxID=2637762 RepID=UPI00367C0BA2